MSGNTLSVFGNGQVSGNTLSIFGNAQVSGNTLSVFGNGQVSGNTLSIFGNAQVSASKDTVSHLFSVLDGLVFTWQCQYENTMQSLTLKFIH